MRVTIAVDDISMPLPPMETPDIRQTVLEVLLDMLAGHGVDDVHIVIAISLHRKMTPAEMKRMVGSRIFDEFYPDRYYNHDAKSPTGGAARRDEHKGRAHPRRCAESDLVIYVNLNFVPMNGGHKSVAVGLCDYESLRAHHDPQTIRDSDSYMDPNPARSALGHKIGRLGKLADEHMNVFHIETTVNNRMFRGDLDFLQKNEDEFSSFDRMKYEAMRFSMSKMPRGAKRMMYNSLISRYQMIACHAGRTDPVHDKILEKSMDQYLIPVKAVRYFDHRITESVLQRQCDPESAARAVMALGYHFIFIAKTAAKKGACSSCTPLHDGSIITFIRLHRVFNRLLPKPRCGRREINTSANRQR